MSLKIIFLLGIISAGLLVFQAEEAFAGAPVVDTDSVTKSTTTILVCFTNADLADAGIATTDFGIDIAGGTNFVDPDAVAFQDTPADCSGGAGDGILLTLNSGFGTGALPRINVEQDSVEDGTATTGPAADSAAVVLDGVPPTFDSAAVTTISAITVTFSEAINSASVGITDFTISDGITIGSVEVSGSDVIIFTSTFNAILSPTVTIDENIDDNNPGTNNISSGSQVASVNQGAVSDAGSKSSDSSAPSIGGT